MESLVFVKLTAYDGTDFYIRVDRIEAVYWDEDVESTAVSIIGSEGKNHVKGSPRDVIVQLRSAMGELL